MSFDFKFMFQLVFKALFASRGTNARLTPKRVGIILSLFPAYILIEITNYIGFLLDEIFFRSYRKIEVSEPVFIIGVPRSGTTFLHRLLAKDREMFTSMKYWEILFAPSITQKKCWMAMGVIDQWIGSPIRKMILASEKRSLKRLNQMHQGSSLFNPEEDDQILIHIFSSSYLGFMFPFEDDFRPFWLFDTEMPITDRVRIMAFYKRCVQRHLFVFGQNKRFLSKNPAFCPKIRSLGETFPDAKIICMVRTPLEVLPSLLSLFNYYYHTFLSPIEPYPMQNGLLKMVAHFYRYPIEELKKWAPERQSVMTYDTLVQNPEQTVLDLYERFRFNLLPRYHQVLQDEMQKARKYKSQHQYSIEQFGLTHEQIISDYGDIFDQFGFHTEGLGDLDSE